MVINKMDNLIPEYFRTHKKFGFWIIQFLIWTLYLLFYVEVFHRYSFVGFRSEYLPLMIYPFVYCYFGLPLSMIIKFIIDRYFDRLNSGVLVVLTGFILPVILGHIWFILGLILDHFIGGFGYANPLVNYFWDVFTACLLLIAWSSTYLIINFWDRWFAQKIKTRQAIILAENAKLRMLRYQLNPHFLFNTLSSLRALIRNDKDMALEVVDRISDFLRYSLDNKTENSNTIVSFITFIGLN
ncbi:histidine kinase, partial [Bacteroidota bacterium]